jgi:hypothetical protein
MFALATSAFAYAAQTAPSGCFEGSVPFIIDVKACIGDSTTNLDINVKIAHEEVKCPTETHAISATQVTFPNVATTGDCMGDALRGQSKDPTKYYMDINSDGTLTFQSDGYPPLKMTATGSAAAPLSPAWQEVVAWRAAALKMGDLKAAAPSGKYCGSVPFIIEVDITLGTTADVDINVKIAHEEVKCPSEAVSISDTQVTFPNVATTGDCMGDNLRDQSKDPTKYYMDVNSDGTLTFQSDGYPPLKMKAC